MQSGTDARKKVILVEDNDLYRAALKDLINAQDDLEVVAEATSGEEAVRLVKRIPADLVILDLRLPKASGYDVLREISVIRHGKIMVLTILESDHNIRAALEAGADGYCFKDVSSKELINAISSVMGGVPYVSQQTLSYPEEKRSEQRQACDCSIRWAFFNKETFLAGRMLNCSRSGCYFETSRQLPPGTTVLIRIEKCKPGTEFKSPEALRSSAVTEVKWCRKLNQDYGVGARYHFPV